MEKFKVKIIKIDNLLGFLIPKEIIERERIEEDEEIFFGLNK